MFTAQGLTDTSSRGRALARSHLTRVVLWIF